MGVDLLDLRFRVEKEFGIKLEDKDIIGIVRHLPNRDSWIESVTPDICMRDFVSLIEQSVQTQHPGGGDRVFERFQPLITDCLGLYESDVTLDSWLVTDLGMS